MCSTDLMATCAAIVGTDLPENTAEDSHNILPVLTGSDNNKQSVNNTSFGFWRLLTPSLGMEIDFGNSRIRWWPPPRDNAPDPDSPGQLYHLLDDSAERHNLWDNHPKVAQRLTHLLENIELKGVAPNV